MKWISTTELQSWANRIDSSHTLPLLVRRLIRHTAKSIKHIKFPAGENVRLSGWDGRLELSEGSDILPAGISVWEFGTNKDIKGKADEDFEKRTANPGGVNPKETTYVFVTPRVWAKADEWIKEKEKLGVWKTVKVITGVELEEWLEQAPSVAAWFAKMVLGKYPTSGIQATDDFWKEWATGDGMELDAGILLGGRQAAVDLLVSSSDTPSLKAIQGVSREEALAFIVSAFKANESLEEDFFSRSIIVDSSDVFRELSVLQNPLILIPRFGDDGVLNSAISRGHTVLVPLGADASDNWSNKIKLPKIDRKAFVDSLVKSGIPEEKAEKHSRESIRNINILRRQLGFNRTLPEWAKPENVRDIIPALIAGRWSENNEADRKIISQLAGENYDDYIKRISKWLHVGDAPVIKIGESWRLASPMDAWLNAAKNITKKDYESLAGCFLESLREINPAFDLGPEKRHMAVLYGKNPQYSRWLKEGLTQSLILISVLGNRVELQLQQAEQWVDHVIAELLKNDNPLCWKSFEGYLPLIAEASPDSFLRALESALNNDKAPIWSLFDEDPGFITPHSYHTGLLWGLEGLAWMPEYLSRVALILAKLDTKDPGGRLSNRPMKSLSDIFKTWHYQTQASFQERMDVLKLLTEREKDAAWKLLVKMLPDHHDIGDYTHTMRWRSFDQLYKRPGVTYKEIYDTHSCVVDLLIASFDFSEKKLAELLTESTSTNLMKGERDKLMGFIQSNIGKINQETYEAWDVVRNILSHHRSYPDTDWALRENDLAEYEKLYNSLTPNDEVKGLIWLFNDHWPHFPEGYNHKKVSSDEQQKLINDKRAAAAKVIYEKVGLQRVIELSREVKEPFSFGRSLTTVITKEDEIIRLCDQLKNEPEKRLFIYGFVFENYLLNGFDFVVGLYKKLKEKGMTDKALAVLFLSTEQAPKIWEFIDSTSPETAEAYWTGINPNPWMPKPEERIIGLKYLMKYNRFLSAIGYCSKNAENMPSEVLTEVLLKAATVKSNEKARIDEYDVQRIFEELYKREDVKPDMLATLEWYYLSFFSSYGSGKQPKHLHNELATKPEFFIDVLKFMYKPDNAERKKDETPPDEDTVHRARKAYELLSSWKQIPGTDKEGNVNTAEMNQWIDAVRKLATECDRVEVADMHIAKILSKYKPTAEGGIPEEILAAVERINTKSISQGFSSGLFNRRGTSSKAAFEGGSQERDIAKYYNEQSDKFKNRYPIVAGLLADLAKGYIAEAEREDQRAERDILEY